MTIGRHQIESAVVIDVRHRDSEPEQKAARRGQANCGRPIGKHAAGPGSENKMSIR